MAAVDRLHRRRAHPRRVRDRAARRRPRRRRDPRDPPRARARRVGDHPRAQAALTCAGRHPPPDPQTLYRRWEDEQWSPFEDRPRDRPATVGGDGRGERDARPLGAVVADGRRGADHHQVLRPGRSPTAREEEATFLATQQVDEARHMQFYARFQDEVVADPAAIAAHVERAREQLSRPPSASSSTRRWSRPTSAWSRARTTRRQGRLRDALPPGHRGHARPHRLQLHHRLPRRARVCCPASSTATAASTTTSSATSATALVPADAVAEDARDGRAAFARRCGGLLPAVADVARPAGADGADPALGASAADVRAFALGGLERRLNIIGVPL